jgi:hypothetical protein
MEESLLMARLIIVKTILEAVSLSSKGERMFSLKRNLIVLALVLISLTRAIACNSGAVKTTASAPDVGHALKYSWVRVSEGAAFPGAYNFPVFTIHNQMWAFHHQGNWYSNDGLTWAKTELPVAGLNSGVQKYVQFNDAIYALGTMEGNHTEMRVGSRIARTRDFRHWQVVAETSELPSRIFYGAVVFKNLIWLMGGFDGKNYYNDVWNSPDGVHWTRVAGTVGWSPRNVGAVVVFKDRIWMIGGGVIDGTPSNNANSGGEVWSSSDGINWRLETDKMARLWGASPVVFDGKLWLVGANRDGNFSRAALVTDDGVTWREETAPWSPRGSVATWVFDNKLYMTGGKYSVTENGEIKFIYSNDVWYMAKSN